MMQKIVKGLFVPLILAALAQSAPAALVSVDDVYDPGNDVFLDTSGASTVRWTHDIRDDGFNPTTDTVLSASLFIGLRDDNDNQPSDRRLEVATIIFEENWFGRPLFLNLATSYGQTTVAVNVNYLQNDGMLTVRLHATWGDFYFVDSTLRTTWDAPNVVGISPPGGTTVPEPGTALLLGIGLATIGLGAARKKMRLR